MRRVLFLAALLLAGGGWAGGAQAAEGLVIPRGEVRRVSDADLVVSGDVVVEGTLILEDARLVFAQDPERPGKLVVRNGGELIARNSTITTATERLAPFPWLNVTIDHARAVFEDSVLEFPTTPKGDRAYAVWLDSSTVVFERSVLRGIPRERMATTVWRGGAFVPDEADDGPLLVASRSQVSFLASRMEGLYEVAEFDWTGSAAAAKGERDTTGSDLAAFRAGASYRIPAGTSLHLEGFEGVAGARVVELAASYVTGPGFSTPAAVSVLQRGRSVPVGFLTPTGGTNELRVDLGRAGITPEPALGVVVRNDGAGDVVLRTLRLEASWRPRESGPELRDGSSFLGIDSHLDLDWRDPYLAPGKANHLHVSGGSLAYLLNVTLDENETARVRAAPAIEADGTGSQVAIFRRLHVRVFDAAGGPLAGARVAPALVAAETSAARQAQEAFESLAGSGPSSTLLTDAAGEIRLTLVSDILREEDLPDSEYVGQYVLGVSVPGGDGSIERLVSLPLFPRMDASANSLVLDVDAGELVPLERSSFGRPVVRELQALVSDAGEILVVGRVEPLAAATGPVSVRVIDLGDPQAPPRVVEVPATEGRFVARLEATPTGKYGVVASIQSKDSSLLTLDVRQPSTFARAWSALPGWAPWAAILLAGGAAAALVLAPPAPRVVVSCGHCGGPTSRDAIGCDRCGSFFTAERSACGGCGYPLRRLSRDCPRCGKVVPP